MLVDGLDQQRAHLFAVEQYLWQRLHQRLELRHERGEACGEIDILPVLKGREQVRGLHVVVGPLLEVPSGLNAQVIDPALEGGVPVPLGRLRSGLLLHPSVCQLVLCSCIKRVLVVFICYNTTIYPMSLCDELMR